MEKRVWTRKVWKRNVGTRLAMIMLLAVFLMGCVREEAGIAEAPLLAEDLPYETNRAGLLQDSGAGVAVQIRSNESSGSGIIYEAADDFLIIVTAKHVIESAKGTIWVVFCDGWAAECTDYEKSENADVAFLRIPIKEIPLEHLEEYYYANIDREVFDEIGAGDTIILMGAGVEAADKAYEGTILESWVYMEDFGQHMMWAQAEALPGMSGGGVFDENGYFLGILCGGTEEGQIAVLPLSIIDAERAFFSEKF